MPHINLINEFKSHPLSICEEHLDIDLFYALLEETRWLDEEALYEIQNLFLKSADRDFYTTNLLHRLSQIKSKIEMHTIRYDYCQLSILAFDIHCFILEKIEFNNERDLLNDPTEILAVLYSQEENNSYWKLPKIYLPADTKPVQLNKLKCDIWWLEQLKTTVKQQNELLSIALGSINEGNQKYASNKAVNEYERIVKANNAFVTFKRNEKDVFLADLKPSDQRRYYEFLTISKGVEKRSKSKGLVSSLITLTLPSEYHPNPTDGNSTNWKGLTPKQGYSELRNIANRFNKVLHKSGAYDDSNLFSIKVIEPHSDGTPHVHILIFFLPIYKDKIQEAIAFQFGDSEFKTNNKAYDWVDIDTNKSSPVHYLCKHFIHSEENSLQDNVQVATNKVLWKIKGFSYTGLPRGAKTLWKELRKLGFQSNTYVNEIEENLIDFACGGDFENFMINLEEAIHTESIKLVYKSKTSSYGGKITSFSHVEYPALYML